MGKAQNAENQRDAHRAQRIDAAQNGAGDDDLVDEENEFGHADISAALGAFPARGVIPAQAGIHSWDFEARGKNGFPPARE
ncbi:hypothetical protein GCM10007913_35940 [Devosia yakushimensis]|uniref:Uncharacterized protein n=1 Tax=Devosia yakushimensis TaxID=470028 RepID=A0ABQ5UHZ2_9HYPH|nr:hypothetical protein GCM10007913_35940 [Devosia yakushimensis]